MVPGTASGAKANQWCQGLSVVPGPASDARTVSGARASQWSQGQSVVKGPIAGARARQRCQGQWCGANPVHPVTIPVRTVPIPIFPKACPSAPRCQPQCAQSQSQCAQCQSQGTQGQSQCVPMPIPVRTVLHNLGELPIPMHQGQPTLRATPGMLT